MSIFLVLRLCHLGFHETGTQNRPAAIGTHGRGARISEVVLLDRHESFYVTCSPGPLLPMERGALVRDGYG